MHVEVDTHPTKRDGDQWNVVDKPVVYNKCDDQLARTDLTVFKNIRTLWLNIELIDCGFSLLWSQINSNKPLYCSSQIEKMEKSGEFTIGHCIPQPSLDLGKRTGISSRKSIFVVTWKRIYKYFFHLCIS
jgi:hypothetical protein